MRNNGAVTERGSTDEAPSMIEERESSASETSASRSPDTVLASCRKKLSIMGPGTHADLSSLRMLAEASRRQAVDEQDDSDSSSSLSELENMDDLEANLDIRGKFPLGLDADMDRSEEREHTDSPSDEHDSNSEDDECSEDEEVFGGEDDGNEIGDEMMDIDDDYDGHYEE